jgi:tetratricopeptide (TPR) repeat protein
MLFLSQAIPDGQRLLIIDNVDDPKIDMASFLPRWKNGAVVVTSRNAERGQLSPSAHLQLDVMSLEESVELVVRGSGREWPPSDRDREAAMALAKELGCHPIALVQAISYMSKTGYSVDMYIARLRGYRDILLSDPATNQLDMRYLTAFAAFDASYDILPSKAQNALHLLSFFHRLRFPLDLVTLAAEDDFSTDNLYYIPHGKECEQGKGYLTEIFCCSGRWNPLVLDQIVASLRNQSLVTVVPTEDILLLEMHSLVHEWSRLRVPKEILQRVQSAAIRLLCCGAREDNYGMMQYLFSHIQALSSAWGDLHVNDAVSFAFILGESGMYADATKLKEKVYGMLKSQHGVDYLDTTRAAVNLANAYYYQGRYNDALELMLDALRELKRRLGVDHPHAIDASANLANIYHQLGRYNDALGLKLEVLKRRKQLLGLDHPGTIVASSNLALTYCDLGRYNEALELQLEVLKWRKQLLGVDHPDTIGASANLANTYHDLGRYNDALDLRLDDLRRRKQLLGVDHPDTIRASGNLANTYCHLGRYNDALDLRVDDLRRQKQLLGVDHPDTIGASANLALTYCELGRYAEAEELQMDTLRLSTSILGDRHPDTLLAMANLAMTYKLTQRGPEGTKLVQKAREIALKTLEDNNNVSQRISWVLAYATSEVAPSPVQEPARKRRRLA